MPSRFFALRQLVIAVAFLLLACGAAGATTSSINPNVPAPNDPVDSYTIRRLALDAYDDINALWAAVESGTTATAPANTVFAGPLSGPPGTAAFRALIGADLPSPGSASLGGVLSVARSPHNFLTAIDGTGAEEQAQPVCADLLDASPSCTLDMTNAANLASGTVPLARLSANIFTSSLPGLVPASGGGTSNFLRSDGTWDNPGGGAPSGSAGGDLAGTYPNPTVNSLANVTTGSLGAQYGGSGQVPGLTFNSSAAAAANTTAINNALYYGGSITINCPNNATVYFNSPLVIYSNANFYVSPGCTMLDATPTAGPALINEALTSSWTTLYNNSGLVASGPLSIIRESDSPAWSTGQSYSKGNYANANGNIYWESAASCTSAGSGSGPSGTGTGITDNTCSWNYVTSYTSTSFVYPTSLSNDPALYAVVNWPSHGLSVGAAVWLTPQGDNGGTNYWWSGSQSAHTRGGLADSAYFGIFPVIRVNDSNNVTVVLRRAPSAAFTGIPMLVKRADQNIAISGGALWNNNYTDGVSCAGSNPISCNNLFIGGVLGLKVSDFYSENSGGFAARFAGVANADIGNIRTPNGTYHDLLKLYGPAFDVKIHDVYGMSGTYGVDGDDFLTLQPEEPGLYGVYVVAAGDIINARIDNIVATYGQQVGIYLTNANLYMDNIEFSRISSNNGLNAVPAQVTLDNFSGQTQGGTIGLMKVHDIASRNGNGKDIVFNHAASTTINQLDIYNIDADLNGSAGGVNIYGADAGTVNQINETNITGQMSGGAIYTTGGTVNQFTISNSFINFTGTSACGICGSNGGTIGVMNVVNNYITGDPGHLTFSENASTINLINNYMPNITHALTNPQNVSGNFNTNIYVSGNYAPNETQGLVRFSGSSLTANVSSGGGNNFGSSNWFTYASGSGQTETVYGWDVMCDVTKLSRTTGEYCFNTNTSPGSGTLNTSGLVADQGTSANSWFLLANPSGQQY